MKYTPPFPGMIEVRTLPGRTGAGQFSELPKDTYWFNPTTCSMFNRKSCVWLEGHVISTGQRWTLRTPTGKSLQVKLTELQRLIKLQQAEVKQAEVKQADETFPTYTFTMERQQPAVNFLVIGEAKDTGDFTAVDAATMVEAKRKAAAMLGTGIYVQATITAAQHTFVEAKSNA